MTVDGDDSRNCETSCKSFQSRFTQYRRRPAAYTDSIWKWKMTSGHGSILDSYPPSEPGFRARRHLGVVRKGMAEKLLL